VSEHVEDQEQSQVSGKRALKKKRGIYLLPNLFTTGGLFAGFYAIIGATNQKFELACVAIFVAMIMDMLDGRVARMTNTQSAFGAEYDSMSDMVSFGIAPALIAYNFGLQSLGKIGWLAAFVYAVGGALRLARFNTQVQSADKNYFQGLASPAAAAIIASYVWVLFEAGVEPTTLSFLTAILTIGSGILMVSNVRYHSFKGLDLKGKVPFFVLLVIVATFVLVAYDPPKILFVIFVAYALSGPVYTFYRRKQVKAERIDKVDNKDEIEE